MHPVLSIALNGIEAVPAYVETDICFGLPAFHVVGLPDTAVKEARERIRAAIKHAGFAFPHTRLAVNLAPADVRKQGPMFDLPIAVSILAAQGDIPPAALADGVFIGELALDGSLRSVRGALATALSTKQRGLRVVYVPEANAPEAASVEGVQIIPVLNLQTLVRHLNGAELIPAFTGRAPSPATQSAAVDLRDIRGQSHAKRGLEIAAAGGHNALLRGPPGTGKTLLARALSGLLPPLGRDEAIEATLIASAAGLLPLGSGLLEQRPFRAPHHSSSAVSLVGGGAVPHPGEASLAHRGVLFLDELPEFPRTTLDQLRQPLEDGEIVVSRASGRAVFPARFILIAAMNPCPCGYAGDPKRPCVCPPHRAEAYRKKVSGPLLDRFDVIIDVPNPDPAALIRRGAEEPSARARARVVAARERQRARFGTGPACRQAGRTVVNADVGAADLDRWCTTDAAADRLLERALTTGLLSARGWARVRKVARTIADLEGVEAIQESHVAEALQYRFADKPPL